MNTGEWPPAGVPSPADGLPNEEFAHVMTAAIQQLANQLFQSGPDGVGSLPAAGIAAPVPVPAAAPPPSLGPPPNFGRSTFAPGGGLSPAASLPPFPGVLHSVPLASAPPPKEKDLRTVPTLAADAAGLSSPAALMNPFDASAEPYFLGLANRPSSSGGFAPGALQPPTGPALAPLPAGVDHGFGLGALQQSFPGAPAPHFPADGRAVSLGALPGDGQPAAAATPFAAARPASVSSVSSPSTSVHRPPGGLQHEFHPELVPDLPARKAMFDAEAIRRDFPILEERVHGKRLVWLDNAATTQKPRAVIDRLTYFYEHENSNIHRAAHALAARATDAYEGARDKVRRLLNAPSANNIVFARGTTEAINLVAQSWGRRHMVAGDEIVISWLEHHANIVPWQQLCAEKKLCLRVAPVDDRGQIILEEYERLLGPKTRLVSFTQVSNALGTITPAREMVAMAHKYGARVLVDGAQAVSHMPVDVQSLDCDFYVFSGHKLFGPTGIGALYGKEDALAETPPWQGGGNMIADVTFEKTTYQAAPTKFEAGTGNIADAVGLGAAIDYVTALGLSNIGRYEHELLEYATDRLSSVNGLHLIGTAADKAGVLSFVIDGLATEEIGGALDQEGIAVRSGHHCAQPILRRFGVERSVRASLAPYNTRDDIDALVAALRRMVVSAPGRGLSSTR